MKKVILMICLCSWCLIVHPQISKDSIKIGSFNIQNFGGKKIKKSSVVDTLVHIVRIFDVIAIQEISDVSNQVPTRFLSLINEGTKFHYKIACSSRTGRQKGDKLSQEQYAFYYNSDKLILIDTALYNDTEKDYFQREPFNASFSTINGSLKFILSTIHTRPKSAVDEIGSLIHVANWIPGRFIESKNIIFCGDFNASCQYASSEELQNLPFHKKPFNWIIPDTIKTNLSKKSDCAYDRFVVTDSLMPNVLGWSVLHYFKSKTVSDHWPVSLELKY